MVLVLELKDGFSSRTEYDKSYFPKKGKRLLFNPLDSVAPFLPTQHVQVITLCYPVLPSKHLKYISAG